MKSPNRRVGSTLTQSNQVVRFKSASLARAAAVLAIIGLLACSSYFISSAADSNKDAKSQKPASATNAIKPVSGSGRVAKVSSIEAWNSEVFASLTPTLLPVLQSQTDPIATYAPDCTTPKTDFNLGDGVCAKASGVPNSVFPWKVLWLDPDGFVRQSDPASSNDQTEYRFTVPANPTSQVDGKTVDNRGSWRANLVRSNGSVRATARFIVHEPANPVADVFVQKIVRSADASTPSGSNIAFVLVVGNQGPDAASAVHLIDSAPEGETLVQFTQQAGPPCVPADTNVLNNCIIATLANGDRAEFTAIYSTGAPGTYETSATVSSATVDNDTSNNTGTTQFTVTGAGGGTSCQLLCPDSINATANTTEGGLRGAHVSYEEAVSSGTCGSISSVPASGSFFPVGQTIVNVTSETGDGSCSFSVTVDDPTVEGPTISCPANQNVNAAEGACSSAVDPGTPTTTGTGVTVSGQRSDGQAVDDPYPGGTTTIVWTATDSQNRTVSCTQTITVHTDDTTPPSVTAPPDVVQSTGSDSSSCGQIVGETELGTPTASDNCGTVNINRTGVPAGNFFPVGTTTITYTATDGAGVTATATQLVTVTDDTPPLIVAPADASYTCLSEVPAASPSQATRGEVLDGNGDPLPPGPPSDNCGTPTVTVTESTSGLGSASSPLIILRTFTAIDAAGNGASSTQTITVIDATAPTISAPANATFECASLVPVANAADATASDNCTTPTVTVSDSSNGGAGSTSSPLVITRTFTATDAAGNSASATQTLTVRDTTPPTITAPADASYQCANGIPAADPDQATASDNCTTATITVSQTSNGGTGSSSSPLIITRTYTATDAAGNSASDSQIITVVDNTPPSIALTGPNLQVVECHTSYEEMGAIVSDNCSGTTAATVSGSVNVNVVGSYTITYSGSDAAGNVLTPITRTVNVVDTTKPVITRNGNASVTVECHTSYTDAGATAADSCDSSVPVTVSGSVNVNTAGTYTLTYNAVDDSGNTAVPVTRTVNVVDTTMPTITIGTSSISMWPPNHKYKTFLVTNFVTGVSDSCQTGLGVSSVVIEKVTSDEAGPSDDMVIAADCKSVQLRSERDGGGNGRVYTITFRLRDAAGNTKRATAKVVVPHDQGGGAAVDSGVQNTVISGCP